MSRNWIGECADLAVGIILRANYNRRPDCEADWIEVGRRFDVRIEVFDGNVSLGACQTDDAITVLRGRTIRQTCARICHEVVEYLLTTEMEAPYNYRPRPGVSYDQERHAIARAAERRLGLGGWGPRRRRVYAVSAAGRICTEIRQRYCARKSGSLSAILRSGAAAT